MKRSKFSEEEDDLIVRLHKLLGNRLRMFLSPMHGHIIRDTSRMLVGCMDLGLYLLYYSKL